MGHSLLELAQYPLQPGFIEDVAICFFLSSLPDIPPSVGTKKNLANASLYATGNTHTHHSSETFLVGAISQLTWLSGCD